jgi:SAGA-associated factor 29
MLMLSPLPPQYDGFTDEYNCKDEDDMDSKLIRVESDKIIRLDETLQGVEIGDNVLAVFPDTTSFYRAVVQKIVKAGHTSEKSVEVVVKFADDEDESGITPGRKVPARYVMPQPRRESAKSKRARQ